MRVISLEHLARFYDRADEILEEIHSPSGVIARLRIGKFSIVLVSDALLDGAVCIVSSAFVKAFNDLSSKASDKNVTDLELHRAKKTARRQLGSAIAAVVGTSVVWLGMHSVGPMMVDSLCNFI